MTYDTIIRGGRYFDGTRGPSAVRHVGIRDGQVVAVSPDPLDETGCQEVIDAAGQWVLPGMVDIHTHYDVEVLDGPDLTESVRHGVTTILLGSCSLLVLDPERLDEYAEAPVEQYAGLSRIVNRNDDTVTAVLVGGRTVWRHGAATALLGHERTGQFLRAGETAPAPSVVEVRGALAKSLETTAASRA